MALPTVFAACTAEDIVSENNALQQDARAKLSKNFVLNTNNEVESRYAVTGSTGLEFTYEDGDLIGANLIDVYNPTLDEKPEQWVITPYVAPSLPFKNLGGDQWKSDAELGVGNYLFTYPFNAKDNGRAAAQFELPRTQKYSSADANAIVEANNKAVGAVVLYEGQTEANVALKNLYTYPKFVINFDNGENVHKVTKVVLQKGQTLEQGFVYKGGIHHEAVSKMFKGEADYIKTQVKAGKTREEAYAAYWAQFETSDFIIDGAVDATLYASEIEPAYAGQALDKFGKPEYTNYLVVEMDEAVKANATTNNKSVEVRLMMPSFASIYSTGITMHVVTDNGTYAVDFPTAVNAYGDFVFKTDNEAKIAAAFTRSTANTLRTKNLTMAANPSTGIGNIITTAADWNALVESKKASTQDVEVSIISAEFALTKDLKMPENKEGFTINTPISVEGAVTLSNIAVNNTITVKEGATLTTSGSFTANNVKVEKGGELVYAPAYDATEKNLVIEYAGAETVENNGTVTVQNGAIAKINLTNKSNLSELYVGTEDATRAASTVAVANLQGTNEGKIYNNGIINVIDDFTNYEASIARGYEQDEETLEWTDRPTIINKGEFLVQGSSTSVYATFTNEGLFENHDSLAGATKFGKIVNNNIIDSKLNALTYVTTSDADSKVVVYAAAPENFDVAVGGTIEYTPAASPVDLSKSPVNHLIVDKTMVISSTMVHNNNTKDDATDDYLTSLAKLTVTADATITFSTDVKVMSGTTVANDVEVTNLIVKKGVNATLGGNLTVSNLTIEETGKVSIPAEKTLAVEGTQTNNGTIYVNGTLKNVNLSYKTQKAAFGTLVEAQGSTIYSKDDKDAADNTQNQQTAAALATAQKNALRTLVDAYLMYSDDLTANSTWSQITVDQIKITNWDGADEWWKVTVVADFVTTWDAITNLPAADKIGNLSGDALEAKIEGLFTKYSALIYTAKNGDTAASGALVDAQAASLSGIKAAISKALNGNVWVGENVFVKSLQNQKESAIESAEGVVMYDEFKRVFESLTYAKMGNTAWMTIKDLKAATDNAQTAANEAYPNNIYDYIPADSYIKTYETSEEYKAVKLWISLSQEYADELKGGAYDFDVTAVDAKDMVKFFNEAYMAKQTGGKFANNKLFKDATTTITEAYVGTVSGWTFNNNQIVALANLFATEFGLTGTITPADED